MELEEFIKFHLHVAKWALWKSGFSHRLDRHERKSLVYIALWNVHKHYDRLKSKIPTYVVHVVKNAVYSEVRRKSKYLPYETQLDSSVVPIHQDKECVSEMFTHDEWTVVKPLYEGYTCGQVFKQRNSNHATFRGVRNRIARSLTLREKYD